MVVGNGEKLAQAVDCGLARSWGGLDRTSPSTATGRLDGQIGVSKFRLSELCLSLATGPRSQPCPTPPTPTLGQELIRSHLCLSHCTCLCSYLSGLRGELCVLQIAPTLEHLRPVSFSSDSAPMARCFCGRRPVSSHL